MKYGLRSVLLVGAMMLSTATFASMPTQSGVYGDAKIGLGIHAGLGFGLDVGYMITKQIGAEFGIARYYGPFAGQAKADYLAAKAFIMPVRDYQNKHIDIYGKLGVARSADSVDVIGLFKITSTTYVPYVAVGVQSDWGSKMVWLLDASYVGKSGAFKGYYAIGAGVGFK